MISLHYNQVVLKDCRVERFEQEIVRDQSGTDRMYSRFTVTVSATLTDYLGSNDNHPADHTIAPGVPARYVSDYTTVERQRIIAQRLQEDCGDFWLVVGGQTLLVSEEQTLLMAAGTF